MPVYEYRCNDCAATYEVLRSMADRDSAAPCVNCGSKASMPLISRVSVGNGSPSNGATAFTSGGGSGGCCGGSCGCAN